MQLFLYQLKQAYLSLKKKPGFVFSVVTTMGITLGALLCVATLAYVMLVKPLPYPEQDKLYQVELKQFNNKNKHDVSGFHYPGLVDYYQNQTIFSQAAMLDYDISSLVSHPDKPIIHSSYVTPEWFTLLGAKLAKGRYFSEQEGLNSYSPVAVISYQAWQTLFNGTPDIIGQTVSTRNNDYAIIGVLAQSFIEPALTTPGYQSDFWFPWDFNISSEQARTLWWARATPRTIIGTLADSNNVNQANEKSTAYINQLWQEHNDMQGYFKGWHVESQLHSFSDLIIGANKQVVYLLITGAMCMLFIAMMNIINLLLSRLAENHQNLAVHASIGAKPKDLFSRLFIENSLLVSISLVIALAISALGFTLLQSYLANLLPRVGELSINNFTLAFALIIGFFVIGSFAFIGTRSVNYHNLNISLVSSGKGNKAQVSLDLRKRLIIGQVAIASVLFFVCSNIALTAFNQITYDDGLNADNLLSFQTFMFGEELPQPAVREQLHEQLKLAIKQLPQVTQVSRSSSPLTGTDSSWSLLELDSMQRIVLSGRNVDQHYFTLSGQRLIEGDLFTPAQVKDRNKVVIINQQLAERISSKGTAIGKRFTFSTASQVDQHFTVIGVVSDLKWPGETNIKPELYRPRSNQFHMTIALKDQQDLTKKQLKKTIAEVSPLFKIIAVEKLSDMKTQRLFADYLALIVTMTISFISIMLAFIGLYGILSYSSQMRRFEIGTRLAVGAKGTDILALIIKDNVRALVIGMISALLMILILAITFSASISNYIHLGLITVFCCTIVVISLIALLACYLPLRQYISKPAIACLRGSE